MFTRLKKILWAVVSLLALPFVSNGQSIPIVPTQLLDIGGPGANIISTIMKLDAQNNIYVMGIFSGTVDFDPSVGVTNLTSVSGSFDGYIAKYSAAGTFVWAKSFGGSGTDQPNGLDVDRNGNITLVGQFTSTPMDADPGPGVYNLTAADRDAFILRLDNNGNFLWAKSVSSGGNENGCKVASDSFGNLTAVYWFQGAVDVNGTMVAKGALDGLMVKYDANGNVLWRFSLGAINGGDNSIIGALVNKNDDIIIAGYTNGTVNYNPLSSTVNITGNNSMFLAKYSPAGILQWIKTIEGDVPNYNIILAMDGQDNIYINGLFTGQLNFGAAPTLNSNGRQDIFFAKYASGGNLLYHKNIGGANALVNNYGMVAGPDNNLYLSGFFEGQVDFDPSTPVAGVNHHGVRDMYLAKFDDSGNYQWAFGLGNSCNNNLARYVNVTCNNEILLTGSFCSTVNFDESGCGSANMTAQSSQRDLFIVRYRVNATTSIGNNAITAPAVSVSCTSYNPDPITGSTPSGGNGNYIYQWQRSADNANFTDITGAVLKDYDPPAITSTVFYRRVVSGYCLLPVLSNVVELIVTSNPSNTITAPAVSTFCNVGNAETIIGSAPPSANGISYRWQQSDDNVTFTDINGANGKDHDPVVAGNTIYYRRILTNTLCGLSTISNTVTITVTLAPAATVSAEQTVCIGNGVTLAATGGTRYLWSPAGGLSATDVASPTATPASTTTYTVEVFNGSCSDTLTVKVNVVTLPSVNAGPDKTVFKGSVVQLNGQISAMAGTTYQWSPATYLDNPNSLTPVVTPTQNITYRLTATTANGCFVVDDDVFVRVIDKIIIPNAFTPNGDNINDTWLIEGLDSYKASVINIFNRLGQKVFSSNGYAKPWDGMINHKHVPFGTYYYLIDLKDGQRPLSGYVTLLQ